MTSTLPKFAGNLFGIDLAGLFEDRESGGLPEGFMPAFNFSANIKGRSPTTLTYTTPKTPSGIADFSIVPSLPDITKAPAAPTAPTPSAPAPALPTLAQQYASVFSSPTQQPPSTAYTPPDTRPTGGSRRTNEDEIPDSSPPSDPQTETTQTKPTYGSGLSGQIRSAGNVLSKKEAIRIAGTNKTVAQVMAKAQSLGVNLGSALVNAYSKGKLGPNSAPSAYAFGGKGTVKAVESLKPLTNLQMQPGTMYAGYSQYNVPATSTRSVNAGYSSTPGYTQYNPIVLPRPTNTAAQSRDIQQFNQGGASFGAAAVNRALESGLTAKQVKSAAAAQGINLTKKAAKALKK